MSQLAAGIRSRGVVNSIRLPIAYAVGNAAAVASRVSGRGSGASIKGALMMRIYPGYFKELLVGKRIGLWRPW